ncbi:MAG: DegT/DnrJ/EryC1/StrS family aminotransferase [Thermomicrobiales bacterium]|nr:DegT/DnrJ/EryC1/StrS family aminotransferase [Thermomicrobiales bacterium]
MATVSTVGNETVHAQAAPGAKVPLVRPDLPALDEVAEQFGEILSSGRLSNFGPYATRFENELSERLGAEALAVSSCSVGLVFALQALGLQPGQKVALPAFTFVATAQAVLYAGGVPVFIDIDPDFTISVDDLRAVLAADPEIAMVMGVHTYGLPAQVDAIDAAAAEAAERAGHPIPILYDAAHALGSTVGDRAVGSFGDIEVFSLSATKTLVAGEGGVIASRHSDLIARLRAERNYGFAGSYDAHAPGLNGKMSEFHAVIGLHNLNRLDELMAQRAAKAAAYADRIVQETDFLPPPTRPGTAHTFKDFTILVPDHQRDRRDDIVAFLKRQGVDVRTYFAPALHRQGYFERFATRPLPTTDDLAARVIAIPFFASITDDEMTYVVEQLRQAQTNA